MALAAEPAVTGKLPGDSGGRTPHLPVCTHWTEAESRECYEIPQGLAQHPHAAEPHRLLDECGHSQRYTTLCVTVTRVLVILTVVHPLPMVQDTVLGDTTLQDLVVHPLPMVQDTVLGDTTLQDMVVHPLEDTVGLPMAMVHITEKSEEKRTQDEDSA
ncbi:hypothetical protein HispidOSU_029925 [Sigmodon hispidus]